MPHPDKSNPGRCRHTQRHWLAITCWIERKLYRVAIPLYADSPNGSFVGNVVAYLLVLIVIAFIVRSVVKAKNRRQRIQRFAQSRGLTYERSNRPWSEMDWGYPFGRNGRYAQNVITGRIDARYTVTFDYSFELDGGRKKTTYFFMVTAIQLSRTYPKLRVEQTRLSERAARQFGVQQIEITSTEFRQHYATYSDDPRFANEVLKPQFMQWLLKTSKPGFTTAGDHLVLVRPGKFHESFLMRTLTI